MALLTSRKTISYGLSTLKRNKKVVDVHLYRARDAQLVSVGYFPRQPSADRLLVVHFAIDATEIESHLDSLRMSYGFRVSSNTSFVDGFCALEGRPFKEAFPALRAASLVRAGTVDGRAERMSDIEGGGARKVNGGFWRLGNMPQGGFNIVVVPS